MPDLLIRSRPEAVGAAPSVEVTPASAGWRHVGFAVHRLPEGARLALPADALERCLVVLAGTVDVRAGATEFPGLGGRPTPFDGLPAAAYLPRGIAGEAVAAGAEAEVAICTAPGGGDRSPYAVRPEEISVELRGTGAMARHVRPILMEDRPAHALLVVEVLTPAGHWSSYPPHKHDRDDPPRETLLEETYYHRVDPPGGFGLQRVYAGDGSLDEALAFGDRDVVLVPRGYHTVAMPPGYTGWYLNVMAGRSRAWRMVDDPAHARLRTW